MKKTGFALLLIASRLSAQSKVTEKPLQLFPPKPPQKSVTKQVLDAIKLHLNLKFASSVTACAIPFLNIPIPAGANFPVQRVTPSSMIDPKMVVKPPLPACAEKPAVPAAQPQGPEKNGK